MRHIAIKYELTIKQNGKDRMMTFDELDAAYREWERQCNVDGVTLAHLDQRTVRRRMRLMTYPE